MVSSMATLTVGPYLSPSTLIRGPVICTTDGLSASGEATLMASDKLRADVSLSSGEPFSKPSLYTGSIHVIPYNTRQ